MLSVGLGYLQLYEQSRPTFDVTLVHRPTHRPNVIVRKVFIERLYLSALLSEMSEMSLWLPLFCTIELQENISKWATNVQTTVNATKSNVIYTIFSPIAL